MIGYFKLLDHWIASFLKWSVIACFFGLFVLMISGVLQRFIPEIKISGYEEMIEFLFVWMTYLGATAMWREGMLYRVGAFDNVFSKSVKRGLGVIIHLFMIALCWVLIFNGSDFALSAGEITPFLQLNKIYWYAAIPICGCFMAVYSLISLVRLLIDPSFEEHQEVITLG